MLAGDSTEFKKEGDVVKVTSRLLGDKDYIVEKKYDGSRYILQWDEDGKVFLTSRNVSVKDNLPVDKTENLRGYLFDDNMVLAGTTIDGEILVKINGEFPKDNGSSEVNKIMLSSPDKAKERLKDENIQLVYKVYDVLFAAGTDIRDMPLIERKRMLEHLKEHICYQYKDYAGAIEVAEFFESSEVDQEWLDDIVQDSEGAMFKLKSSHYIAGDRKYWQKVKRLTAQDGVILGAKKGTGKYSETLGALSVGQFFGDELQEVATISGMTDEQRDYFWSCMKKLVEEGIATEDEKGITLSTEAIQKDQWCVEFIAQEKTKSRYRHPRFVQERFDKPISDCIF